MSEKKKATARLIQADAVGALMRLGDASVDLIITDPPYESLEKYRAVGTTTRLTQSKMSSNKWFTTFPNERFEELFSECYRVMKKDRHLYMFCDDETSDIAKAALTKVGFKVWKRLVWDKVVIGMGYHYRCRYEFILFAEKGKRKIDDLGIPDVLRYKRIVHGYPAEKPVTLQEVLVKQSTTEGETVLDPFCGSATSGAAALAHRRNYIGVDTDEEALKAAVNRLESIGAIQR